MNTRIRLRQTIQSFAAFLCLAGPLAAQVPHLLHHQGRVAVDGVNFDGSGQFKFSLVDGGTDVSRLANARANINHGVVESVTVVDGGAGYRNLRPPHVTIKSKNGSGADLVGLVSGGAVVEIGVISGGSGYEAGDLVLIDEPSPSIVYQQFWSNDGSGSAGSEPTEAITLAVQNGLFEVLLGDTTLAHMTAVPAAVFDRPDVRLRTWFSDGSHGFQRLDPDKRIAAVGFALMAEGVPDGAITAGKIAAGAVGSPQIAAEAVQASNIAGGAVGASQLASEAVHSSHIASGAVGSAQIAPGAVTSAELAKPPRSGSIPSSSLAIEFNRAAFSVSLTPGFADTPMITLACNGSFPGGSPSVWVESSGPAMFTGRYAGPLAPLSPDSSGRTGDSTSLAIVDGYPAISYHDATNGDLMFVLANSSGGTEWRDPRRLDSTGSVGSFTSLAVIDGNPAISYYDSSNGDLKYIRSNNANGSIWSSPVTVDSAGDVGRDTSLTVAGGRPAISYYDSSNGNLKFVRATDVAGDTWGTPVVIDSAGDVGRDTSLAIVSLAPAISYHDETNGALKFARARAADGADWGDPLVIDSGANAGPWNSLCVVNGNPAISYRRAGRLRYVRATDASGMAWGPPVELDSLGEAVSYTSLAVIGGKPAISYRAYPNEGLKFVRATDADGSAWGAAVSLDSMGNVGLYTSLAEVDGKAAISYHDRSNGDLKFIRAVDPPSFTVEWIALEP